MGEWVGVTFQRSLPQYSATNIWSRSKWALVVNNIIQLDKMSLDTRPVDRCRRRRRRDSHVHTSAGWLLSPPSRLHIYFNILSRTLNGDNISNIIVGSHIPPPFGASEAVKKRFIDARELHNWSTQQHRPEGGGRGRAAAAPVEVVMDDDDGDLGCVLLVSVDYGVSLLRAACT